MVINVTVITTWHHMKLTSQVMAEQFHIHGLHWQCSCAEAWYGACTEGCGPYQTLTPAAAAPVVVVVVVVL